MNTFWQEILEEVVAERGRGRFLPIPTPNTCNTFVLSPEVLESLKRLADRDESLFTGLDADKKPACECGAKKLGATDYSPEHSSWCPVAEEEETQET